MKVNDVLVGRGTYDKGSMRVVIVLEDRVVGVKRTNTGLEPIEFYEIDDLLKVMEVKGTPRQSDI